ncbi:MAG: deoxynucleoside kinase [Bacteroidales bacterium]|jgi:deoxyadenosine/deoxycytidine kinase|nr:deoxynucleoside kinase [Bacteroidales bacterium]
MEIKFLVIEGNIGAGKTSLCKKLAEDKNGKLILEQFEENPFLSKFYENQQRYAFPTELSFLSTRYKQIKEQLQPDLFHDIIIADYFLMKSLIFSSQTLEDDEYQLYRNIFDIIFENIPKPDLYVYLHKTSKNLLENIKKRGRDYEQNISSEYLENIEKSYFSYFRQQSKLKILIINTDEVDFIVNEEHYEKLKTMIFDNDYNEMINYLRLNK